MTFCKRQTGKSRGQIEMNQTRSPAALPVRRADRALLAAGEYLAYFPS